MSTTKIIVSPPLDVCVLEQLLETIPIKFKWVPNSLQVQYHSNANSHFIWAWLRSIQRVPDEAVSSARLDRKRITHSRAKLPTTARQLCGLTPPQSPPDVMHSSSLSTLRATIICRWPVCISLALSLSRGRYNELAYRELRFGHASRSAMTKTTDSTMPQACCI